MVEKLSTKIIDKYKDSFEETETTYGSITQSLSILVMSLSELKHIVDYCVRTMPIKAIEEIRK
jgi:hypothetical protein